MNLYLEMLGERRLGPARADAAQAEFKAENALENVRRLEGRIDRLLLVNMALWSLLKEETGLTDHQLAERVREIDEADGTPDGRVTPTVTPCPKCGQTISLKHQKCLFCGYTPDGTNVFAR
jgi:hypothetical protein